MKKIFSLLAILIIAISAMAGTYEETMGKNIGAMLQTQDANELNKLANTFDRIAQKEATKWLPYYYSCYAYTSVLFFDQSLSAEAKNAQLDKAQAQLDKAIKVDDKQGEVYAIQGLIYQMRITDPSLGYEFSTKASDAFAKSEKLNSKNPRLWYLKGSNLFYTPEQYGGGKTVAKPLFEKAQKLFEAEAGKQSLMPSWGSEHNEMMLKQCE